MSKILGLITAAALVAALSSVAMASPSPTNAWQASRSSMMSPTKLQHKLVQQAALRATTGPTTLASSFNMVPSLYGYARLDRAPGD